MAAQPRVIDQLVMLGFSQYEARTYVGLVGKPAMTGYALSNATQVPQPKVYETLRRLEEKRAVLRTSDVPARFVAVAPEVLLDQVESRFRSRLADARDQLSHLADVGIDRDIHAFEGSSRWEAIATAASDAIARAGRHVHVSAHAAQLGALRQVLEDADARSVRVDVLSFGKTDLRLTNGRVQSHSNTVGGFDRHHPARHLAVVVDGKMALWALAPDGSGWDSLWGDDPVLTSVVTGYIRQDTYVQQIYADFRTELDDKYGPGLEALAGGGEAPGAARTGGAAKAGNAESPRARRRPA